MLDKFSEEVTTLARLFHNTVENFGERPAIKYKVEGFYHTIDYNGVAGMVKEMAAGLISLGLEMGDHVCLMAQNSAYWEFADWSIMNIGAATVTAYPSLSAHETVFILNHSGAKMMYVGTEEILHKVQSIWKEIPDLQKVIVLRPDYHGIDENVLGMSELRRMGRELLAKESLVYENRWKSVTGTHPATLVYTSGTTGVPKGTLLDNHTFIQALARCLKHVSNGGYSASFNDVSYSLMPLSHTWERNNSYLGIIAAGGCIGYGEKPATLLQDIQAIKPTWYLLVPRIWDRLFSGFRAVVTATPEGKQFWDWAFDVGEQVLAHRIQLPQPNGGVDYTADPTEGLDDELKANFLKADTMLFSRFKQMLGGRSAICYSGGGALPPELHHNLMAMNFPLLNGWGLTETASGINHGYPNWTKLGWMSQMVPGVEMKQEEDGELLVRGAGIPTSYYKNPEETALAFTEDGWFRTGDLGDVDEDGFLRIIDRKKSIIVLDTGKNVAPLKIEGKFVNSPMVEQVMVVGDNRKFITALIVPAFDAILPMFRSQEAVIDETQLNFIEVDGIRQCIQVGQDFVDHPLMQEIIRKEVDRVNEELEEFESIKRYCILARKMTEEDGELTPTLKVKKKVAMEHFKDLIEDLYQ